MTKNMTKEKKDKKLGISEDDLSVDNLLRQAREVHETFKKVMPNKETRGYPRQKTIKGRVYFYLIWYITDAYGKRRQRSLYLGTTLPKGYSLGKSVKIE